MRLWSLHPSYLDRSGLLALWRESLLAQKVLEGETRGYRHHPQLERFRKSEDPAAAIAYYLSVVYEEACNRGYKFDASKFRLPMHIPRIRLRRGQLDFERTHLLNKLKTRDPERYRNMLSVGHPRVHPLFTLAKGGVEPWERV